MKNKVKAIVLLVALVFVICLSGCGKSLSGMYVSESGKYGVEFEKSGECTWYQNDTFFDGNYEYLDGKYKLEIRGHGFYANTVFFAAKDDGDLVIDGGTVKCERFVRL